MSIYIEGMEMPKDESEVLILAIKSNGSIFPVRIDGEGQPMIFPNEEMKNHAVPVPEPHGKLIDADAVTLTGGPHEFDEWCKFALERYLDAPTVIPASEEG